MNFNIVFNNTNLFVRFVLFPSAEISIRTLLLRIYIGLPDCQDKTYWKRILPHFFVYRILYMFSLWPKIPTNISPPNNFCVPPCNIQHFTLLACIDLETIIMTTWRKLAETELFLSLKITNLIRIPKSYLLMVISQVSFKKSI